MTARNDNALAVVRNIFCRLIRLLSSPESVARPGMTMPDPTSEAGYREIVVRSAD